MGRSRTSIREAGWVAALLAISLVMVGCAGITPYEPRNHREEGPKQGLFTGPEGEFVIFRKADAPETEGEETEKKPQ